MKQSSFWQKTKAVHFNNADLKSETKQKKTFLAHLYAAVKKVFTMQQLHLLSVHYLRAWREMLWCPLLVEHYASTWTYFLILCE